MYTATWTTKKTLVDATWSLGASELVHVSQLFLVLAVAVSVGYTVLLVLGIVSGLSEWIPA